MKRITKIFLSLILITCIFLAFASVSNALNMNLDNDNQPISQESNQGDNPITQESNTENPTPRPASATPVNQTNKDFFTPENILNMFLITVGVVLILLAIAILIRLK